VSGAKGGKVEIRAARPGDAGLILALIQELAEYERLRHECVATESEIAASLFASAPRTFCEIAEVDGQAVGFALWFYNFSTFKARHGIYLEDLYVRPQFRGQGAGKALLKHLAARAMHEGCARFEWWVLDWNTSSIRLYEALGARAMEEWTVFRLDGEALARLAEL